MSIPARASEHVARNSLISKIDRYKWSVSDAPGRQLYIDKNTLHVDEAYQRKSIVEAKVLRMASAWSWVACGTITVGDRNGKFHVIDGQNRVLAAKKRSDIVTLPCLVFETADARQEAAGFVAANTHRKPISFIDRHRALLVMDDPVALRVETLVSQSGRVISSASSPTTISCIALLTKMVINYGDTLDRMWPLLTALCAGHPMVDRVLSGLMHIEARMPEGTSLTDKRWRDRLLLVGFAGLHAGIIKASAFYARGGDKVFASGIAQVVNAGLRNKLEYENAGIPGEV